MKYEFTTVADLMSAPVTTLRASQSLPLAHELMKQRRIRHLPVVDDDQRIVGLVSHRDLLRARVSSLTGLSEEALAGLQVRVPVRRVMTTGIRTVGPDTPAFTAAEILLAHGISCLPVVDAGRRVVGIVTEADFVDTVVRKLRHFASIEVARMMTRELITLNAGSPLPHAEELMTLRRVRHLPVVDDAGHLVGLVTHRDLLSAQHSALSGSTEFPASATTAEIMRRDVWSIAPTTSVFDAARTLSDHSYGCLPVVSRGTLVGIVTEADFVRLLQPPPATNVLCR